MKKLFFFNYRDKIFQKYISARPLYFIAPCCSSYLVRDGNKNNRELK